MLHRPALLCIALQRSASHCAALHRTALLCLPLLRSAPLCCTALHRSVHLCIILRYSASHCTALHLIALLCIVLHLSVSHRTAGGGGKQNTFWHVCGRSVFVSTYFFLCNIVYTPNIANIFCLRFLFNLFAKLRNLHIWCLHHSSSLSWVSLVSLSSLLFAVNAASPSVHQVPWRAGAIAPTS